MGLASFDFLEGVPVGPSRLSPRDGVILYGAGTIGKELAAVLVKRGISVVCFLDRGASAGATANGIPIRRPEDPEVDRSRHAVIVSIFNRDVCIPDVIDDLRRQGYGSVHTFLDIHDDVREDMGDRFWLTTRSLYGAARGAIEEGFGLWADEQSRELYRNVLQFRVTGNYDLLPPLEGKQYFPDSIPPWKNPLRLVDAGAYDGDTLRALLAAGHELDALAAFEPDSGNFSRLADFVRAHRGALGRDVTLFPCGLWSRTEQVRFSSGQGEASHVSEGAGSAIQCVRLDDAVPAFAPTLIKLDVEGAERDALQGAAGTIKEHLPSLAVCLYHRPDDLWTIPLQIRALSERYRLYLRGHGHSAFDLVLYAISRS